MRRIIILGASGSIGKQTIDLIERFSKEFSLVGFSVGEHTQEIPSLLKKHPSIKAICVKNKETAIQLRKQLPQLKIFNGDEGLVDLINQTDADMVVNALVGFVGLKPTLTAIQKGIDVGLANKESLVVGGELIKAALKKSIAKLYPIDSEHVALAKCLYKKKKKEVSYLLITASGGSLRDLTRNQLEGITPEQALKHPTWTMGSKITIDSATMMNKGFEIVEAHYLFGYPYSKIKVMMQPTSRIHSMVRFVDGSLLADIGPSDMHVPISYALFQGKRRDLGLIDDQTTLFAPISFAPLDVKRYPAVSLVLRCAKQKGISLAILNASNELAVSAFLERKIPFLAIEKVVQACLERQQNIQNPTLQDIQNADHATRILANQILKEFPL